LTTSLRSKNRLETVLYMRVVAIRGKNLTEETNWIPLSKPFITQLRTILTSCTQWLLSSSSMNSSDFNPSSRSSSSSIKIMSWTPLSYTSLLVPLVNNRQCSKSIIRLWCFHPFSTTIQPLTFITLTLIHILNSQSHTRSSSLIQEYPRNNGTHRNKCKVPKIPSRASTMQLGISHQ
jgi:hypothetical protein